MIIIIACMLSLNTFDRRTIMSGYRVFTVVICVDDCRTSIFFFSEIAANYQCDKSFLLYFFFFFFFFAVVVFVFVLPKELSVLVKSYIRVLNHESSSYNLN